MFQRFKALNSKTVKNATSNVGPLLTVLVAHTRKRAGRSFAKHIFWFIKVNHRPVRIALNSQRRNE